MPEFKIKMPDGQIKTVRGPDREGAMAFAKANYRPTTAPATTAPEPEVNRSLADGLEFGDLNARANVAGYLGDANQELEAGPVGSILNLGTEYIARPIRGALGLDTKTRAEIADDFSAEQALREENLRKASDDLNYTPMTTADVTGIPSAIQFAATSTAESIGPMVAALASGGSLTPLLGAGEVNNNLKDIEGLSREDRVRLSTAGGAIYAVLENLGIGMLLKGVPKEVVGKLGTKGVTELLERNGLGRLTKAVTAGFASEAVTEAAQDGVSIGAEAIAGKEFEDGEIADRLFEAAAKGGAGGGTIRGSMQAGTEVANIGKTVWAENMADPEYGAAASDLARLLRSISDNEGLNLKDVNTQGAAKQTLEAAHEQISGQIKAIVGAPGVRERLSPKNAETLDQLLEDYAAAQTAVRQGKNKVKSKVTDENAQAIARLLGPTKEAGQLLNLFAQGNVLTDLFADGTKGGVSQFTDYLNPLQNDGNSGLNIHRGLNVIGAGVGATQFGIPATAGIVLGGRAIDAFTGRRSKINRFVKKLEKLTGQKAPEGPSLIAAAALEKQQAEQAKADDAATKEVQAQVKAAQEAENANITGTLAGMTGNATDGSPLGTIAVGTGIPTEEIQTVVSELRLKHPADSKRPEDVAVNKVLDDAQAGLNGEQRPIRALTQLVNIVNDHLNASLMDGGSSVQRTSLPDGDLARAKAIQMGNAPKMDAAPAAQASPAPNVDTTAPAQPTVNGNQTTTSENYQAGIQANRDTALKLQEQVLDTLDLENRQATNRPGGNLTPTMLEDEAEALYVALEAVQTENMPIEAMEEVQQLLVDEGVSQENVDKFYKPYVDRVRRQQKRKPSMLKQAQATQEAMADKPMSDDSRSIPEGPFSGPVLNPTYNPLQVSDQDLDSTSIEIMPSPEDLAAMKDGSYKPAKKQTLVEFAQQLQKRWEEATGRTEPFEQTAENVDQIARLMATEAATALRSDSNAIGWYDRKLKAAKSVVSLVDPRVTQSPRNELAFDFALAVTSNGQAVADNFEYAMMVFKEYMDTGRMPTETWVKGGERNQAMVDAFAFFNTYESSGQNMPLGDFLDQDFSVSELNAYMGRFNADYGTEIKVPSSEGAAEMVKGSYIVGPKIGQGFYQNIRGNYDPLTMDIWWMRMWNRLTGRAFEDPKDIEKNRSTIREGIKSADALGKRLIKETLSDMNIKKSDLKDDTVLDSFVSKLDKRYQSFYRKAKKDDPKSKPPKPQLFKSTGTMVKNMVPQLQAQPKNAGERSYMRTVTKEAISKLKEIGIDISTADFQALMWYPEKQLFRKGGVAPGRGSDNDYLDAAKMLAEKEGISNEQIEQALPAPDGGGTVDNIPSSPRTDGDIYPGTDGTEVQADNSIIANLLNPPGNPSGRTPRAGTNWATGGNSLARVALTAVKRFVPQSKAAFQVGKRGTPTEDGIQSLDQALSLAHTLGITVRLFDSQEEMYTSRLAVYGTGDQTAVASFYQKGQYAGGKGAEGTVFGLNPGAMLDSGGSVSGIDALSNLIHEIAHGMTLSPLDLNGSQVNDTEFTNPVTGQPDKAPMGSFAGSALRPLLEGKGDPDIMSEIDNLQMNVDAHTTNDPAQRSALREVRKLSTNLKDWKAYYDREVDNGFMSRSDADTGMANRQDVADGYTDYMQSVRELAVDPVLIYLINPKLAKSVMPKTAALIREQFNNAGNKKVKFFSHPAAVVIATVMAMLAQGMAEEEEEKQRMQMPPGALTPPPPGMGALTA